MKNLILTATAGIFLASAASAGGMSFSLPNLWFPPADDVTVTKDALSVDATTVTPLAEE
ncbi:hypothetical protein L0666_12680 [Octadecabacter sp. CECT 8868]|uniref:hypothetical protein n=1 Tax=Octadecabacter algicola TaxID=2909342 RepID=UPI001F42099E|nr:hypothetical protein [Octadecabacter algicola]MCF2905846.1 hypothetical protein [Octadecabacter algicola]